MLRFYKYKYEVNAEHNLDYNKEKNHFHTFTIGLSLKQKQTNQFYEFDEVNRQLDHFFNRYQGVCLNDLPEFQTNLPTLENMGDYFFDELAGMFHGTSLELIQLEISENPLRVYMVSSQLLLSSQQGGANQAQWLKMLQKQQRIRQEMRKSEGE